MKVLYFSLFSGIGGFDIAADAIGWKRVGFCEKDVHCIHTYRENFDIDGQAYYRDITKVDVELLPNFDILFAGFPCQPFSSMGKHLGFEDVRGTLFFDVARILKVKRPRAFLLENVGGLIGHNSGKTFLTMLKLLSGTTNSQQTLIPYPDSLGYNVSWKVLNSSDFGVPQNRKRVYIVGFETQATFEFPQGKKTTLTINDILEESVPRKYNLSKSQLRVFEVGANPKAESGIKIILKSTRYDSEEVVSSNGLSPTLKATGENCPPRIHPQMRFMTPRECARLQGFPDTFKLNKSNSQAYGQLGNSVTIPVVAAIMREMAAWIG